MTPVRLAPKNGSKLVALIAGGPADRFRELQAVLAEKRNIDAKYHWNYERPNDFQRAIPDDVDFAILLKTQIGHANGDLVVSACKAAGVTLVKTSHKWSVMEAALRARLMLMAVRAEKPLSSVQAALASAPGLQVAQAADPRLKSLYERKDTAALIRELQQRMVETGISTILLEQTEVTLSYMP